MINKEVYDSAQKAAKHRLACDTGKVLLEAMEEHETAEVVLKDVQLLQKRHGEPMSHIESLGNSQARS